MNWVMRTMFVRPGPALQMANALAAAFPSSKDMWSVPVSASGGEPADWVAGAGLIDEAFAVLLPMTQWAEVDGAWVAQSATPGDTVAVVEAAVAAGHAVLPAQVEWLWSQVDISDQPFDAACARLGLVRMTLPEAQ